MTNAAAADAIDEGLLERKLEELEKARAWSPRLISKLEALMRSTDPFALYRVNPVKFAADRNLSADEAIDLFLHATKVGLFRMEWRLLCPSCSDTLESFASLSLVHTRCFCSLCQLEVEAALDDLIQVSFNVAAEIRAQRFHRPEELSLPDYAFRYRFDAEARAPGGTLMVDLMGVLGHALDYVDPGATRSFATTGAGGTWAIHDMRNGVGARLPIVGAATTTPQLVQLTVTEAGWQGVPASILPGPIVVEVTNQLAVRCGFMMFLFPPDAARMTLDLPPRVTGNRLLSNQTFRTLFRSETVERNEGIGIRDLTLLFTDLKGSTAMYDRIGDLRAFALVQRHFGHLATAIQAHRGAIVKTIGDAVMASFASPLDAVAAALLMREEIAAFNLEEGQQEIVLKIGIHRGASIAVTLNDRLDFFGTNVNIAARVQGLAEADEVCLTAEVYNYPGVLALLGNRPVQPEQANLKGIARTVQIHRVAAS